MGWKLFDAKHTDAPMSEQRFIQILKDMHHEVIMPAVNERVANMVHGEVRTVVYQELADEIHTQIRAAVSKAVREGVTVSVRAVDISVPPGI